MRLALVNKICYTICVVSVCGSTITGLWMVWSEDADQIAWRFLMSFLILFLAAGAMIAVNAALLGRRREGD